jgi:LemA protein
MDALILLAILFVGISPALYALVQYNTLVALRNHIREAWSNIDTELKRRYDLIPRLVEVTRGYAKHEREVLERVAELRDRCAANHGPVSSQARDESELVASLRTLLARAEAYPELKADAQFQNLHKELVNTEDRIQAARRFYNGNVRELNQMCDAFPTNMLAGMFGFERATYFELSSDAERVVPRAAV